LINLFDLSLFVTWICPPRFGTGQIWYWARFKRLVYPEDFNRKKCKSFIM